jgi:hypothetical protein
VRGRDLGWPVRLAFAKALTLGAAIVAIVAFPVMLYFKSQAPWLPASPQFFFASFMVALLAYVAVAYFVGRHFALRAGEVSIYSDRIVFTSGLEPWSLPRLEASWNETAAFDDGARDYVVLLPKRGGRRELGGGVAIPTLTETVRTEVLAVLDRHGIRRP